MPAVSAESVAAPGVVTPGAVASAWSDARDLAVSGLRKRYDAEDGEVLAGVGFELNRGESLAVLGANGSGKSTMLRCCLRLVEPDAGHVNLLGCDVIAAKPADLRQIRAQVGFVFQRHNLVPRLSVLSNVLHGALGRSPSMRRWFQTLAPQDLRDEAMECLGRVGLADLASRRADRLSGGQSQRVAIARALMQRPRLVFADEPAASLDPNAGEEIMELFAHLMRAEGVGVVFTCHDLRHAKLYGDRVLALKRGQAVFERPNASVDFDALNDLYEETDKQ